MQTEQITLAPPSETIELNLCISGFMEHIAVLQNMAEKNGSDGLVNKLQDCADELYMIFN